MKTNCLIKGLQLLIVGMLLVNCQQKNIGADSEESLNLNSLQSRMASATKEQIAADTESFNELYTCKKSVDSVSTKIAGDQCLEDGLLVDTNSASNLLYSCEILAKAKKIEISVLKEESSRSGFVLEGKYFKDGVPGYLQYSNSVYNDEKKQIKFEAAIGTKTITIECTPNAEDSNSEREVSTTEDSGPAPLSTPVPSQSLLTQSTSLNVNTVRH